MARLNFPKKKMKDIAKPKKARKAIKSASSAGAFDIRRTRKKAPKGQISEFMKHFGKPISPYYGKG